MTDYILTEAAEADLRAIIRYTRQHWGEAQVRRYVEKLENAMARLAAGQGTFRQMETLFPGLRMMRCGHHHVFCLPRVSEPALVVAILHERMDLLARLSGRL